MLCDNSWHCRVDVNSFGGTNNKRILQQEHATGTLGSYPPPQYMSAHLLTRYICLAVKQNIRSDVFWRVVITQIEEKIDEFTTKEIMQLLIAFTKFGVLNKSIHQMFANKLTPHLHQLNMSDLSKVISAVSKNYTQNEYFISMFYQQLMRRRGELESPLEFAMILNSLSKIQAYDKNLYSKLSESLMHRLHTKQFHIREVSVIVSAYASANHYEEAVFNSLAECLVNTLREATTVEIGRVVQAFTHFKHPMDRWYKLALQYATASIQLMGPNEICLSAFAFGKVKEVMPQGDCGEVDGIFEEMRHRFIAVLPYASQLNINSFLHTYCRWMIPLTLPDIQKLIHHLIDESNTPLLTDESRLQTLYAILSLFFNCTQNSNLVDIQNEVPSIHQDINRLLKIYFQIIKRSYNNQLSDIASIVRVVEMIAKCRWLDSNIMEDVCDIVMIRHRDVDSYAAAALLGVFSDVGWTVNGDLKEGLEEKMKEKTS